MKAFEIIILSHKVLQVALAHAVNPGTIAPSMPLRGVALAKAGVHPGVKIGSLWQPMESPRGEDTLSRKNLPNHVLNRDFLNVYVGDG